MNTHNTTEVAEVTQESIPSTILENLFVDNTPPREKEETKQSSKIQIFLDVNYSTVGFNDGYDHHSNEFLDRRVAIIKAEFRQILDESIDMRKVEIFKLKNQQIETRGLSERLVEQVELRIVELNDSIVKLDKEKELSAFDEGLVMKSIHQYKEGFLRGCKDYHEVKLFAQSTGLFNS